MEAPLQQPYSFGPFVLDPVEKRLLRDGQPIALPPKALDTLFALVEHRGHVMEKGELLERIWPNTFVEEATLTQNIFTLRKALGDSPDGHQYIETIPKRGYRFVAPVRALEQPRAPANAQSQPRRTPARRLVLWALLGILVLVTSAGLYFRARSRDLQHRSSPNRITLAVLPFQNLTPDPSQEYFSDGLTEEMITQLGGLNPERLGVIARTSAMHYKGTTEFAGQIGRELGVDYLVEGSLRRQGSRVRISAQLIRVRDQMHLWAQDYDRDSTDYLALERDVTHDIAAQIQLRLSAQPAARASPPSNPNAYDAYLKGRFFWNKRSEQGHLKAIEYFNQAITTDPGYAQAYSGLADAYALLGSNPTTAITRQEAMSKARDAALKALTLDDAVAEAHTSLAFVYWHYDWNWPAAEKEFRRALQLNPSYPTAHHWFAYYLVSQGRTDQSIEEIRHAQETDPLSVIINTDFAQILYFAHRYDQAIEQAKRALEMDPQFSLARLALAWSYLEKHRYEAAVQEAKNVADAPGAGPDFKANLAATYAAAGQATQARDLLLSLKADSERQHAGQLFFAPIAQVYAALGEKEQAFAWLEKDFQNRNGGLTLIKVMPFFDSLHGDPRFADLVRRIGLPASP
jgi:TolB-like protein/DNA-binding winged helix-turn-helix (wHTH) protein/Flp pilus assembly protein TadD